MSFQHTNPDTLPLADNIIVVTGASSGFGENIARRCGRLGASVVLVARSTDKLDALAAELSPQRTLAVPTDVTSDADVARLVSRTLERFGRCDVLINNAGFGVLDAVAEAKLADLQGMMDVNVYGALRCTQAFLPHMRARRFGQIVMMASQAGLIPTVNLGFYTATKHALVGVSRSLTQELRGTGVRCALICPGVAMTSFMDNVDTSKFARISRIGRTDADTVTDAVVRAIYRRTNGEVVIPAYVRLLAVLFNAAPNLSRWVMSVMR